MPVHAVVTKPPTKYQQASRTAVQDTSESDAEIPLKEALEAA